MRQPITALAVVALLAACGGTEAAPATDDAPRAPPPRATLGEAFMTAEFLPDNLDTPAVWHASDSEALLLVTAKKGDVLAVFDAATGRALRRVGRSGNGPAEFRRPNAVVVVDDMALVVERDNHRVQVLSLPDFRPLGTLGERVLRTPYGISAFRGADGVIEAYVTDQYEFPGDTLRVEGPEFGERVKHFRIRREGESVRAEHVRSFGATSGAGVLTKVESILADPAHDRVLVADERLLDVKVYDRAGEYTGRSFGGGLFTTEPEGIALYPCGEGGYLIATDQHPDPRRNTFLVFDRVTLRHLGGFGGRQLASTDGVWLTQRAVGSMTGGAFFAQHDNRAVGAIPWREIADALDLRSDCTR